MPPRIRDGYEPPSDADLPPAVKNATDNVACHRIVPGSITPGERIPTLRPRLDGSRTRVNQITDDLQSVTHVDPANKEVCFAFACATVAPPRLESRGLDLNQQPRPPKGNETRPVHGRISPPKAGTKLCRSECPCGRSFQAITNPRSVPAPVQAGPNVRRTLVDVKRKDNRADNARADRLFRLAVENRKETVRPTTSSC